MRIVSKVSLYLHKTLTTASKPICFSHLIRNFYSCLSPLLPAYSCVLGVSVSRQQQLCGALLSFPNTYYYLCCQSPTTPASPARFTLGSQKSEFLPGSLSPPPQPKRKEHAQGPGEFPHSQVPSLYPKSDPNPNWGKNSVSISSPTQHPSFHEWKTWKNERVQRGHMILLKDSDD